MKLTDSIYMVASGKWGFSFTNPLDCNAFLIDTGDGCMMVDAGVNMEPERITAVIESHGFKMSDIKKLFLTHYHADHAAGAEYIRQQSGCQVYAPEKEAIAIETGDEEAVSVAASKGGLYPADYVYPACKGVIGMKEGDSVTLGNVTLTASMVPGHSLEDMVVYGKIDGKQTMFSGDCVFACGQVLLQSLYDVSLYPYKVAMNKLAGFGVEALFPGHGVFSLENGGVHIDTAAAKFNSGLIPPQLFFFA